VSGPKRGAVKWRWIELGKEELRDIFSSQNIIRFTKLIMLRWMRHVALVGSWTINKKFSRKPEGKTLAGSHGSKRMDNLK
jgi:hypothetical protein